MTEKPEFTALLQPLVVICGPTATGKTALAVELALEFNGEIISADSRQVYRGLDLGTGKDIAEYTRIEGQVPCHLIDIADPVGTYSLYDYVGDFHKAFHDITARKKLPIACGGTGLYLEAVLKNYRIADVPENVELRNRLSSEQKEALIEKLQAIDESILHETDLSSKKRIIRAIEVAEHKKDHGVRYTGGSPLPFTPLIMAVRYPREELLQRINNRLQERLEEGLIEEVRGLLAAGISAERLISLGMEYKYITEHVTGILSRDEMIIGLQTAIHRLAKRQMTWFRGMERRGLKVHWLDRGDIVTARKLIEYFLH